MRRPGGTTEPAASCAPVSTSAPSETTAPMPMSALSSMVAEVMVAPWPVLVGGGYCDGPARDVGRLTGPFPRLHTLPTFFHTRRPNHAPIVTWFPISTLAGKPVSSAATVEMTAWSCTFVTAPIFTLLRSPVGRGGLV